jgi:hypothetical protein
MPVKCYSCGKQSRGNMPTAKIDGEERSYCADCLWKLEKEYERKKTCEECAYFSKDRCKKTDVSLTPVTVGFDTYFVQAENCNYFAVDKEVFLAEAKKLEAKGNCDEAAALYDKIGMSEKAGELRNKTSESSDDVKAAVKALTEKNQTLTYFCCHCGAPLKIGAKSPQIQMSCPRCGCDLEVIDLGKLINQHS